MFQEYRNGYGNLTFSNGGVYKGFWKINKMHGKGTLYYPNGQKAYEGYWYEDQFNEYGHLFNNKFKIFNTKFDYKDFSQIKNQWIKYEGEFNFDKKQGFGTIFLANGEKYIGNFKQDKIHGYGMFYDINGQCISGYWENNLLLKKM
ncbi:protein kinase domain protein [Ichthyophthirius multifiliis]|uniref:Protein kinase domain protein n=1 Tax=Ichthyophthirius multifiliis TaxID=5932 RepID=G0QX17_ICHMU|nr:protein kinase domain protein [Ichthyophthirius multifiliis]EGR30240.1 protein kinase domain protein [Ichthyophthirius multifiliis]|eukprot:XP_004031836.1 protein kinase domain protein [Ichthyophthirius multifiliis]